MSQNELIARWKRQRDFLKREDLTGLAFYAQSKLRQVQLGNVGLHDDKERLEHYERSAEELQKIAQRASLPEDIRNVMEDAAKWQELLRVTLCVSLDPLPA